MIVQILGKRWQLKFCRMLSPGAGEKPDHGQCDHPDKIRKEIRINSTLEDRQELEAIIHECAHAARWHVDEEFIEQEAYDLSVILWRLNYRRNA